jgi:hypothetical protein
LIEAAAFFYERRGRKMAKKDLLSEAGSLTTAVVKDEKKYEGPYVQVFLPELEDAGDGGMKVDQYEHVTLANETGLEQYRVHRGEHVMIPVPVFIALKEKYPKL